MDYSFSGNISPIREYDPFRHFQAALRYLSSDHGDNQNDRYRHDPLKKQKVANSVKIFAGSHRTLSFSEEIVLYSPEMLHSYESNKIADTPTVIAEFINSHDQVTQFIMHGALMDGLPYAEANCYSTEHICSRRQSIKSKRRQNPTNISKSTLAKSKRNNNRKKNKAVKRLNPVQNSLHQNGLKNLQSSIDYIRTLLK